MNRLLAFLLSFSLVALTIEPAAAAEFSEPNIPDAAPIGAVSIAPSEQALPAAGLTQAAAGSALPQALDVLPQAAAPAAFREAAAALPEAAPAAGRPAARAALTNLAAEVGPKASAPRAAMARTYDEAAPAPETAQPVETASPARDTWYRGPARLDTWYRGPARQARPSVLRRLMPQAPMSSVSSQAGSANVGLIAAIGGVVLAVALTIGLLIHHGQKQDAFWTQSKANADIVQVERAQRAGDAQTLYAIAAQAQARQAAEREQVAEAQDQHADKIGTQSVSDVRKLEAFDGMVAARAALAANEISHDSSKRLGAVRPEDWKAKLDAADAQARAAGSEGQLATQVDALGAEVNQERSADAALQADLQAFSGVVPSLGAGRLKEQRDALSGELSQFENGEIAQESALHDQEVSAMRGRIFSRLEQGNAAFKAHADHQAALAAVADGSLKSAVELAQGIDDNLRDMSAHLANKAQYLKDADDLETQAGQLTHVPIYVQAKDAQGNLMFDGQGRPVQVLDHYEDQSQPKLDAAKSKRDQARSEADEARGLAISAARSAVALRTLLGSLRQDPALQREDLASQLPSKVPDVRVYIDDDWYDIGSADLDFFLNQMTQQQADDVRARFGGVVGPLEQARATAQSRAEAESQWLNQRVDQELAQEESQAK